MSTLEKAEPPTLANAPWAPRAPVRGAQSFVGTMGAVWRRPGLTLREVLWRWAVGVPCLALVAWQGKRLWPLLPLDTQALTGITVFRPLEAFQVLQSTVVALGPVLLPVARWLLPLLVLAWTVAWALGRRALLPRLDPRLQPHFLTLFGLRALRTLLLVAVLFMWGAGLRWAAAQTVTGPGIRGEEPNLVGFCALAICGSLLLYVGWAAVNWLADAPALLAAQQSSAAGALGRAFRLGRVRGKLAEINLVMGIVKIALLVLALVFSACPLPFETVASEAFLRNWWTGVAVLYFLASDFFHVVRSAAYLALFREYGVDS